MKVRIVYNDKCGCCVEFENVVTILETSEHFTFAIEKENEKMFLKRIESKHIKHLKILKEGKK